MTWWRWPRKCRWMTTFGSRWRSARCRLIPVQAGLIRIRSGVTAQLRGLPRMRFVRLPLGEALQGPGYLGQQVRPPGRELAQPGHRDRLLGPGELPPPRVMLCRTRELGGKGYDQPADAYRSCVLLSHRTGWPASRPGGRKPRRNRLP